MKILCVIDNLGSGGAQRQLVGLALGFKERGNVVSFLVYHNNPFYNSILKKAGISILCIEAPDYLHRLLKMRKFIRRGKFDSVLSFLEAPNFICEFTGIPYRKWKLVVGERNADSAILKSTKLIFYRWFHFFADFVVSNSHANMLYVHQVNPFLKKSKCKVIYNIVDLDLWKPLNNISFCREDARLRLIVAASYIHRKNLNGLIEAVRLLNHEEIEKIVIEWYGDRPTESYHDNSFLVASEKIKAYGLEKVIKLNPVTQDIAKIINESDAVGLFSFIEGLPNVVCEGMACAKPVVCSNISDVSKFLSYDANLLCDPADPHSIKNSLSYLINLSEDRILEIGQENKRISEKLFDKEKIVSDYLNLLKP